MKSNDININVLTNENGERFSIKLDIVCFTGITGIT